MFFDFFSTRELCHFSATQFPMCSFLSILRHSKNDGVHLGNELDFWNVHGIMNTWVACTKGFTLTLQETRSVHDSMNRPNIEFIAYIYIL